MYRLSFIVTLLLVAMLGFAQNPHGTGLKYDCKACHTSGSWDYAQNNELFDHASTSFPLEGRHQFTACKDCHGTLVFEETAGSCVSCHTDVHSMSVGNDCARCHTPENWLVDNIPELHEANGFPLVGEHGFTACSECHQSETNLRWDRVGNECNICHMSDYNSAPNHVSDGFSTNCIECHEPFGNDWAFSHFVFPIYSGDHAEGEAWNSCTECHTTGNYSAFSCIDCHEHNDANDLADEHDDVGGYQFNSIACLNCHPRGSE